MTDSRGTRIVSMGIAREVCRCQSLKNSSPVATSGPHRSRGISVPALIALLFVAMTAWPTPLQAAQQPALITEAGLQIHAVARRLASPSGAAAELHWVPDPFPGPSNVIVSDPDIKAALIGVLMELAPGEPACPEWVLENSQTCTLGARLARRLAACSFRQLE